MKWIVNVKGSIKNALVEWKYIKCLVCLYNNEIILGKMGKIRFKLYNILFLKYLKT